MNRTVKGMVATGIVGLTIFVGGGVYDTYKQLDFATKEINRLEQKVERQGANIKLLQNDKVNLQGELNKLGQQNQGLIQENENLKLQNQDLHNQIEDIKKNYINVQASAYIATCSEGCSGRTASGEDVTDSIYYNGLRVIATDTDVIPMYSIVDLHFKDGTIQRAIALDTGGAINGHKIDLLVNSESEARKFGRQEVTIHVIKRG